MTQKRDGRLTMGKLTNKCMGGINWENVHSSKYSKCKYCPKSGCIYCGGIETEPKAKR